MKQQKKLTFFLLFFLPILISLGFWQLERAAEKRQTLLVYQEQANLPVESLDSLAKNTQVYYGNVRVEGEYDATRYWLLDNQPRNGQVGYEVLMPFITDNSVLIVNRGWVKASQDRQELPSIDTPEGRVEIIGSLALPQKNSIISSTASDLAQAWPKRVLQLDLELAALDLETSVLATTLRIDSDSPGAYTTEWPVVNTKAEKHQAYAVQWFAMALALVTLYIVAIIKSR